MLFSAVVAIIVSADPTCFCSDASLCEPIKTGYRKEIYGFMGGDNTPKWEHYDWSMLTTLAWADDDMLTCFAHSKGVRVIMAAPGPVPLTANVTARREWVESALEVVRQRHMDGVVFDFEDPLPMGDPRAGYYAQLINETTRRFHQAIPGSQVSVCLAWSPYGIDGRNYANLAMIEAADLAYIMDYDTRSQVFDACVASANAPYAGAALGLQQYLDLGADPGKLVLGVPWYGYDYVCEGVSDPLAWTCPMKLVPFRGVNCSDAAGRQVAYQYIAQRLGSGKTSTGRRYEDYMGAPFYNYVDEASGAVHQVWYDDPDSLTPKYQLAKALGLRGVGPYTFDDLDYTGQATGRGEAAAGEARAMWDAFRAFLD